ncbi:MAG: hypothetical protein E6Q97_39020 [Desulfurellales bacterium]|nr:MAG: hypothetical protein E6Q97_39020 [Desulfurellales bacterium]
MQIEFISLNYRVKTPSDIEPAEFQRQLALLAASDCAAIGRFIEQATALIDQSGEAVDGVHMGALLNGFGVIGRLLGGLADQAIAAIEELREIDQEGPRNAGATFGQGPVEGDILELAQATYAEAAA